MRLLHTSDWHLGQHFYGKSRAREHQLFLDWLITTVKEQAIDAVIVAGDIFDTGTPPSYAREMYFDFVEKMHQVPCKLVIIAGNHDSVAMLSESKNILKQLSTHVIPRAISLDEETDEETDEVCADAINETNAHKNNKEKSALSEQVFYLNDAKNQPLAVICGIPFIRPRDVIKSKAGQSATEKQQSLQEAISEHYHSLFEQAKILAKNELPIIATGHLTTVGVKCSESVRDIYIGTLDAFPANAFPEADYIALGHIHRSQKVAKSGHIRYSGSPIPLSFDEAHQDKKVCLVTFDQNKQCNVEEIIIPRFQPILMIKTVLDNLQNDVSEGVKACLTEIDDQYQAEKVWLDIEIESAEYLADLNKRIEQLIEDLPAEILLVRRSKKSRKNMTASQDKTTLNELSLLEVFDERLALEPWDTPDEIARRPRLTQLFNVVVEEIQSPELQSLASDFKPSIASSVEEEHSKS